MVESSAKPNHEYLKLPELKQQDTLTTKVPDVIILVNQHFVRAYKQLLDRTPRRCSRADPTLPRARKNPKRPESQKNR